MNRKCIGCGKEIEIPIGSVWSKGIKPIKTPTPFSYVSKIRIPRNFTIEQRCYECRKKEVKA